MADVKKPEDDKTITENKTPANETPTTDKSTAVNEQLDIKGETPPPDKTAEDAAALGQADKSAKEPETPTPAQADKPAPSDKVVNYDFNPKSQKFGTAEQVEQGKNPQVDKTPEEKSKEEKAPEAPKRARQTAKP